MRTNDTRFVKKYQRESQSPWDDDSTMLLLAEVKSDEGEDLKLSYERYITMHFDELHRCCGISLSKTLADDYVLSGRYLEGEEMYRVLLMHIDEMAEFCTHYAELFESIFLLEPRDFFEAAEIRWSKLINEL